MGFGGPAEEAGHAVAARSGSGGRAARRTGHQLQVDATKCRDVLLHREQFECAGARGGAQPGAAPRIEQQFQARVGQRARVARRYDQARTADDLADRSGVGGDGGAAAEHRRHEGARKALRHTGEDQHRTGRVDVLRARQAGAADLLEGDRVGTGAPRVGGLVGEELGGQHPALGQVGGVLRAGARGADDAQGRGRFGPVHAGEGVQQRDEVLGGFDGAGPHQRRAVVGRGVGDGGEAGRVHARVHRAQALPVRAAAFLPAPGAGAAGSDERGLGVRLGGQRGLEGAQQGAYGGARPRSGAREVALAKAHAVLGEQEGRTEEAFGQQSGEGDGAAGRDVAEVDRGEPVTVAPGGGREAAAVPARTVPVPAVPVRAVPLRVEPARAVPVQRERTQGALQLLGHGQQVGHACAVRGAQCAGRAAGALQDAYGLFGAEEFGQAAVVAGQLCQAVQTGGETVRLILAVRRAVRCRLRGEGPAAGWFRRGEPRRQVGEALREPPPRTPSARPGAPSVGPPPQGGGQLSVQRRGPHHPGTAPPARTTARPARLRSGVRRPGLVRRAVFRTAVDAVLRAPVEGVDLELVAGEPTHEPVAPRTRLTGRIRATTLGEQSNAHERTPVLPDRRPRRRSPPGGPPLPAGRSYAEIPVTRRTVVRRATGRGEET